MVHHNKDKIVLTGLRDVSAPSFHELPLSTIAETPENRGNYAGWPLVKDFSERIVDTSSIEAVCKEARMHSPAHFKGLIVLDKNFHRVAIHSLQYEQVVRLKALQRWEREGEWESEEERDEGAVYKPREDEGEVNYFEEREKCYLELLVGWLQIFFSKEKSRNRKGDRGKWKNERKERKGQIRKNEEEPSQERKEEINKEKEKETNELLIAEESPLDETFLRYFPEYKEGYLAIRQKFDELGKEIYERLNILKAAYPSLKEFAKVTEKEKHKSVLFILFHRGYPSLRAFYADYECVHEWRIEKVSRFLYEWIQNMQKEKEEKAKKEKGEAEKEKVEKEKGE